MINTKNIVALIAIAKAQNAPQGGAKLFANSLNGVNVDDFLSNYGDVDYSGNDSSDDYLQNQYGDLNGALGEAPQYVYEDVGPSDDSLDYFDGNTDYYDGTNQANAGRPNGEVDSANKSLNSGISKTEEQAFNVCRKCEGETNENCQNQPLQTCNDAQDSCQVEVRSQYEDDVDGSRTLVHRYWSRCAQRIACDKERERNFIGTNKLNNQCLSSRVPRRLFSTSKCTFCTKLGQDGVVSSLLFGVSINSLTMTVNPETNVETSALLISDMLHNPDGEIQDFWTTNNWYTIAE